MKNILYFTLAIVLASCAQTGVSPKKAMYQAKSTQVVTQYANAISRGIGASSKTESARRGFDYSYSGVEPYYPVGQIKVHSNVREQVSICKSYVASIAKKCANFKAMTSIMAQCLDNILTSKNPVMTHAYNQMVPQTQQTYNYTQYWSGGITLPQYNQIASVNGTFADTLNNYSATGSFGTAATATGNATGSLGGTP